MNILYFAEHDREITAQIKYNEGAKIELVRRDCVCVCVCARARACVRVCVRACVCTEEGELTKEEE